MNSTELVYFFRELVYVPINAIIITKMLMCLLCNFWTTCTVLSSLYVCMAIKYIIVLFVETPRKFITAKLSITYY
jgi:hypothetical protein